MVVCALILNFILLRFLIILGIIFTALHRQSKLFILQRTISNLSSLLALKVNPFAYHKCKRKKILLVVFYGLIIIQQFGKKITIFDLKTTFT